MVYISQDGVRLIYTISCVFDGSFTLFYDICITQRRYLTSEMQLFFTSLLLDVHMWLNMFRASPRPS